MANRSTPYTLSHKKLPKSIHCRIKILPKSIISDFMDNSGLKNLVRSPTCFRSDSPKCIDLILTNRKRSFQNTETVHTGLSDFHAMIVTALKGGYKKKGPKIIRYRNYAKFCAEEFTFVIRFRRNCRIMRTSQ